MSSTKNQVAKAYDSVASFYDDKANKSLFENERIILSRFLKNHNRRNVLDIGGGTCRFFEILKGEGEYVALDISRRMLEFGKRCYPIEPIVADAEHLPVVPDRFDLVVMLEMLQFLSHPELAFQEIRRVMSKPGIAAVTLPNLFWEIPVKIMLRLGMTHWPGYSKETRSIEEYERVIRESDLEVQETSGFTLLPLFPIVSKLVKLGKRE